MYRSSSAVYSAKSVVYSSLFSSPSSKTPQCFATKPSAHLVEAVVHQQLVEPADDLVERVGVAAGAGVANEDLLALRVDVRVAHVGAAVHVLAPLVGGGVAQARDRRAGGIVDHVAPERSLVLEQVRPRQRAAEPSERRARRSARCERLHAWEAVSPS